VSENPEPQKHRVLKNLAVSLVIGLIVFLLSQLMVAQGMINETQGANIMVGSICALVVLTLSRLRSGR
jgi:hypothetical protein